MEGVSAELEKGTRFRDGELGDSHAHGFERLQNKLIYDTYRKSGNRVERREKEKDRPLHTPSWPSKLLAARERSARKKPSIKDSLLGTNFCLIALYKTRERDRGRVSKQL